MFLSKVFLKITSSKTYLVLIVMCTILLVYYNFNNKFELYKSEIKFPLGEPKDIYDLHNEIVETYLSRRQVSTNPLFHISTHTNRF